MTTLGYVATLALPLIYQCIPNPIGVWWLVTHRNAAMPPEVLRKATAVSGAIAYFQVVALGSVLALIINQASVSLRLFGQDPDQWVAMTAIGVVAGSGWLILYVGILARVQPSKEQLLRHEFIQRSLNHPGFVGELLP